MSDPVCVNLQERFGRRYRVSFEAKGATKSQWPREDWPWLMEIESRYGVIYPQGGDLLAAMAKRPRIGAKLRGLRGVLTARGAVETVVTFHVDDVPAVFALLRPRRRRQVSATERERLLALSALYRFGAERGVQSDDSAPESTIAAKEGQR